jgi:hypothetical protein
VVLDLSRGLNENSLIVFYDVPVRGLAYH